MGVEEGGAPIVAKKEFILQGFTTRTHAAAVRELFDVEEIQRVLLSVAFVNESGVDLIADQLRANATKTTIFAGIRNDVTTYQGLLRLHRLHTTLYTVDTGLRTVIFHPKLFLVRGSNRARLVIGSANLTLGGLNNNIEAGLFLDFDLAVAADKAVVESIENQLDATRVDHPEHVVQVRAKDDLDAMKASGRLLDEMALPPPRPSTATGGGGGDNLTRIKLKVRLLRRTLTRARPAPRPPRPATGAAAPVPAALGVEFELVWESKPLTRRDLTIPDAANTHATGSVNLDKGLLPEDVDHRHYFRDDVFNQLAWAAIRAGKSSRKHLRNFSWW